MHMIGKTISHYQILEKLGQGGMGVVYKAEDTKLKRTVALKFLPPELTRDPEAKTRFVHEAQAASALDHPNICTIFEIDEAEDRTFISMACYEGETLKKRVAGGQVSVDSIIDIGIQIAQGLSKAHEKGIVHRDIKPGNILITEDGHVKIVDFGLAKLRGKTKLTKTGTTLGTVAYMSPEQARGEEVDHRTDIWSLGVILYEMLTGKLPFESEYEQAVIYSILNEEPEPITASRPEVPRELSGIVQKAISKTPAERYKQTSELLDDLKSIIGKLESKLQKEQKMDTELAPSIAVLPFVNMSPDPENEYFGDGLAEELINALTRLKGLRVAARTSSFCFKGRESDIREIGRQLSVTTVLEGSVRKAGNRLRITAQLINIEDGYHLWSERYDREMEDIFAIQDEITAAIVEQLKVKLVKKEGEPLVKRYTENLDAYSFYLKGRYYWNTLTADGLRKSFECYQKAIEIDPNYAMAYVGLSIWYQSLTFWGEMSPREAVPKSLEYAHKAIELDDSISDAHNLLATTYAIYEWNVSLAEREFKRTLELDQTNALGCINYAILLTLWKRFEEALSLAQRAQKLDPLSSLINTWTSMIFMYAGLYDKAVEGLQQVILKDPDFWQSYLWLSVTFISRSKFEAAVPEAEKAVEHSGGASIALAILACAYYQADKPNEGEEILQKLKDRSQRSYVPATFFVWLHLARNEADEAYCSLQKAVDEHDGWLCFYGIGPHGFRADDPRFDELLKEIGLGK